MAADIGSTSLISCEKQNMKLKLKEIKKLKKSIFDSIDRIVDEIEEITNDLMAEDNRRFLMVYVSAQEKISKSWCFLIKLNEILSSNDLESTGIDLCTNESVKNSNLDSEIPKKSKEVQQKVSVHNETEVFIGKVTLDTNLKSQLNPEVPDWKPNHFSNNPEPIPCSENKSSQTIASESSLQKESCSMLPPSKLQLASNIGINQSNLSQTVPMMHPSPYNYSGCWVVRPQAPVPNPAFPSRPYLPPSSLHSPWRQQYMQPTPAPQNYPAIPSSNMAVIARPAADMQRYPVIPNSNTLLQPTSSPRNVQSITSQPVFSPSPFLLPSTPILSSTPSSSFPDARENPESCLSVYSPEYKPTETVSLKEDESQGTNEVTENRTGETYQLKPSKFINTDAFQTEEVTCQTSISTTLLSDQNTVPEISNSSLTSSRHAIHSYVRSRPFLSCPVDSVVGGALRYFPEVSESESQKIESPKQDIDAAVTSGIAELPTGFEASCPLNNELTDISKEITDQNQSCSNHLIDGKETATTEIDLNLKQRDPCLSNKQMILTENMTGKVAITEVTGNNEEVSENVLVSSPNELVRTKSNSTIDVLSLTSAVDQNKVKKTDIYESLEECVASHILTADLSGRESTNSKDIGENDQMLNQFSSLEIESKKRSTSPVVSPDQSISNTSLTSEGSSYLEQLADSIQSIDIVEGDVFEGIVVQLQDPAFFWFQALNTKFEALLSELSYFYSKSRSKGDVEPLVGLFCCAYFDQDEAWHRVQIKDVHYKDSNSCEISKITVFDIDYGNLEDVSVENVKKLDKRFASLPAQAICCSLGGIMPADGSPRWSDESVTYFNKLVFGQTLSITILEKVSPSSYTVKLEHPLQTGQRIDIANYLIREGYAIVSSFENEEESSSVKDLNLPEDAVCAVASNLNTETNLIKLESSENESSNSAEFSWNVNLNSLILDTEISFLFSHIETPTSFYIHILKKNLAECFTVLEQLQDLYDINKPSPLLASELYKGMFCVAFYPEDKRWYRAMIVDIHEKRQRKEVAIELCDVLVLYVDYGNKFWIKKTEIRPLLKAFEDIPRLAVHCCLHGIMPQDKDESEVVPNFYEWSEESVNTFSQFALDGQIFEAQIFNKTTLKEGELHHLNVWNANDPEKKIINQQFLRAGLAKPIPAGPIENEEWNPMESDYLSDRNLYSLNPDDPETAVVGYKAQDESRICKFYRMGKECWREMCPFEHIYTGTSEVTTDEILVNCHLPSLELPPPGTTVAVQISSFVDPSNFYVIFPYGTKGLEAESSYSRHGNDDKDDFEIFSEELNSVHSKISDFHKPNSNISYSLGEIVVACADDNRWYRAKISEVDDKENRVQVFYVDFGGLEWVPEKRIKPIETNFLNFPVQAVQCTLGNIEAVGNDGWDTDAVDLFQNMFTQSKVLVAQILEIHSSVLIVDLYDTTSEFDIHVNEYFVKKGFAQLVSPMQWCFWQRQRISDTPHVVPG